jgi:2-furoyl-CoA dehydrogenase 2Fe-2S iron sulfur subunit
MSLDAFLTERPDPSEQELREVVGGHLCRCTGYTPIIIAALEAAAILREERAHA